ncbi:hypothetical protein VM1G_02983 [Cytospora mali]|uniref:CBF1-interacting co-repressor CIR N-terminal domain-containing protein n=1 Tax=Cytospora mali TaxID=578113 RepID=A0A194VSE8_CYTMA|nr:hypothetical protein VM1G_02983 [Valsa mali]
MPLHLLGKKSWNVYNADSIARVQRDEAAAAAAEQAAEQRMQEVDAARRLAILRGETPPPLPEAEPEIDPCDKKFTRRDRDSSGFQSKKRKRAGEDDTDFEMRLARERAELGDKVAGEVVVVKAKGSGDIVDKAGHINLVGAPPAPAPAAEKNPEHEREAAKKKRELEDQYQMRFSNAAGRDGFAAGAPWYAKADGRVATAVTVDPATTKRDVNAEIGMEAPTKNVWGNDDPKRQMRAVQRLTTDDPLAMMKTGAKRVREVEKERRREVEERERELRELRSEERRREKRRKHGKRYKDRDEDHTRSRSHRSEHSEHSERRHESGKRDERRRRHRDDESEQRRDRDRDRERHGDRSRERDRDHERDRPRRPHGDHEDRHQQHRRHRGDG